MIPSRSTFRQNVRLAGWLPVAGSALGVALLLALNTTVWRGRDDALLPTARAVETVVPLAVGLQAAFLLSPEDESPLELLLTSPRPLWRVLAGRALAMAALQGGVALVGSLAALALTEGAESILLATARWLASAIFFCGAALFMTQFTRKGVLSALLTVILWGGMLLGGDALLRRAFFLRPVHPYLQPGSVALADYARNRVSLTLSGSVMAALAFYLTGGEERLLGVQRQRKADRRAYVWLALAGALFCLSLGQRVVPLAVWLAPVFMMRFLRQHTLEMPGTFLSHLALAAAIYVTNESAGLLYFSVGYLILALFYGLYFLLPFLAHRLVAPRLNGFISTLIFPLAWVTLEYAHTQFSPLSTRSLAYSQSGNLALLQIASVTGMYGVTFLVTWFASVVNWAWERGFEWPRIRAGVSVYAGALALAALLGGARLAFFPPTSDTVRVASLNAADEAAYLARSERAARAGARIVLWPEAAVILTEEEEVPFVARGRELARQEGVYLAMALGAIPADGTDRLMENKVVLIDPSGEVAWEYLKSRPVPGVEMSRPGDGRLLVLDTPYGRISAAICYDVEFPDLIRQAGRAGVDLLLVPSNTMSDQSATQAANLQTHELAFRAVENGLSLVNQNGSGLSLAADYQGRALALMDSRATDDPVMVAHLPTGGALTAYARIGDLFAWLCVAGFVSLVTAAITQRRR